MPAHLVDVAPRLVEFENGKQAWAYEDKLFPNIGLNAVAGRPQDEWSMEPARFDEMRKGCWDIHARIADMDTAGIWASLCFPSLIAGFAGVAFARSNDEELGLACVRAWNDWHHEVWAGTYPERMIPLQLVVVARPAGRGRRRAPQRRARLPRHHVPREHEQHRAAVGAHRPLGPAAACLRGDRHRRVHPHRVGIDRAADVTGVAARAEHHAVPRARHARRGRLAVGQGPAALPGARRRVLRGRDRLGADAARPPRLRDGALGVGHVGRSGTATSRPSEAVQRNFWFCSIDDPTTLQVRDRIGVDHIMVESDYPHADSSWPDTQALLAERLAGLPAADVAKLTHENAARLFRHPLPPAGWASARRAPVDALHLCDRPLLCSPADGPKLPGRSTSIGLAPQLRESRRVLSRIAFWR